MFNINNIENLEGRKVRTNTNNNYYLVPIGTIGTIVKVTGFDWPVKKTFTVLFEKYGKISYNLEDLTVNRKFTIIE